MYHRPNQTDIFVSYLSVTYFQFKFQKAWVTERERTNFRFFDSKLASKRNLAYSQCVCMRTEFIGDKQTYNRTNLQNTRLYVLVQIICDRVTRTMMNFPDIYGLFDTNTVKKPFVTSASFAFVSRLSKKLSTNFD